MNNLPKWYLLFCKSKEEQKAQINLANQNIKSFYPEITLEKMVRGKKQLVNEALFPGYIFVHLNPSIHNFGSVRATRGIRDFVKFGLKFTTVCEELIIQLNRPEYTQQYVKCLATKIPEEGDKVTIGTGPLGGLQAIYQCSDGLERGILLIKLINQWQKISVPNTDYAIAE